MTSSKNKAILLGYKPFQICICFSYSYNAIIWARRCLIGTKPRYLGVECVPVSEMAQRRHPRFAASHQLVVPSELTWSSGVLCTRSETVELSA